MCGGDDTIEPPDLKFDEAGNIVRQTVSGHQSIHTCKSTDYMYRLVERSIAEPLPWFEWKKGDIVRDFIWEQF